jgi:transcriptional antiterminator NusG
MGAEKVKTDLESIDVQPEAEEELAEPEVTSDATEALEAPVGADEVPEDDVAIEESQTPEAEATVDVEQAPEESEDAEVEAEASLAEAPDAVAEEAPEEAVTEEEAAEEAVAEEAAVEEPQAPEADVETETEAEPAEIEVPDDGRAWYVIHCYSGYEAKVKHNLEQRIETMQMQDQIFQVVVPTEDEIEVRDGKRRVVERRVFPGYILVQMLLNDDSWYVVRNTPGVTGFVGMGNEPTPLRSEEVQNIMKRMEAEAPKIKVTFRTGQKVRIIDGPFNEFIGVVDEIDMERAKVRVLVSFFGRETPVELDFLQVEKT